jgi:hypothetical protein
MATTVNTLPPLHRDRHGEVDKRNERIQKEVSALVIVANGLKGQVGDHVDVVQVLSKKLVEVGETIQAMVDTTENLASNVKRIKRDHGIERNCLSQFSNHAFLKKEVKFVLVEFIRAVEDMAESLGMDREAFHRGLYDSTRRIITPPKTLLTAGHVEAMKKIMTPGGYEEVEEWFHFSRSKDYREAEENPGYRPRDPPKAPGTFLRVMKESLEMSNVFTTELDGLRQGFSNAVAQAYLRAHGENPSVSQLQTLMMGSIMQGFSNPTQPFGS